MGYEWSGDDVDGMGMRIGAGFRWDGEGDEIKMGSGIKMGRKGEGGEIKMGRGRSGTGGEGMGLR